jgi:hypothetical protein
MPRLPTQASDVTGIRAAAPSESITHFERLLSFETDAGMCTLHSRPAILVLSCWTCVAQIASPADTSREQ